MDAAPEDAVRRQVGNFASIAEDKSILILPVCLAAMRVECMTIGALCSDATLILLNFRLAGLELFVLSAQEFETIVLLFFVVV